MFSKELLLFVNRLNFLRSREKHELLHSCPDLDYLQRMSRFNIEAIIKKPIRNFAAWNPLQTMREVERDLLWLCKHDVELCSFYSENFPLLLRTIYDPPILLFVRGNLPDTLPILAIVGTRRPSLAGRKGCFDLAHQAAEQGIPVYSGLAKGIDGIAHRGVIDAGGRTVAVLGSGIDRIYPSANKHLVYSILKYNGALVSEYSPGIPPFKHHFPARNRIISGLADSIVIIQAPESSGALITADYALDQGRLLMVHSSGLEIPFTGTKALVEEGAPVVHCMDDVKSHMLPASHYSLGKETLDLFEHSPMYGPVYTESRGAL